MSYPKMPKVIRQNNDGTLDKSNDKAPVVPERTIKVVPDNPLPIVPTRRK